MKELIVALDLELNQPSRRVVQMGAMLGDVRTGEVVSWSLAGPRVAMAGFRQR
jgi:hypothetical protein